MRNSMEGNFTRWHTDIAYKHLYDSYLGERYPHLPLPVEVLEWRQKRQRAYEERDSLETNESIH